MFAIFKLVFIIERIEPCNSYYIIFQLHISTKSSVVRSVFIYIIAVYQAIFTEDEYMKNTKITQLAAVDEIQWTSYWHNVMCLNFIDKIGEHT